MFTSIDKALAAFVASVIYMVGAFGFDVAFMQEHMGWIVPALSGLITYLVPNKA